MEHIYMIGASHLAPVLSNFTSQFNNLQDRFSTSEPKFLDVNGTDDFPLNFKSASIYIGHYAKYWGVDLSRIEHGTLKIAPGFQKLIEEIPNAKSSKLYVFMMGHEHFHIGNAINMEPYDFILKNFEFLGVSKKTPIIKYEIIEKMILTQLQSAICNFAAIRALRSNIEIVNIVCPPPISNNLSDININFRIKIYHAYVDLLTKNTDKFAIKTILPPEKCFHSNGLLNPIYVGDNVHGNKNYGFEVLKQIKENI